jgi:hypothetical protein
MMYGWNEWVKTLELLDMDRENMKNWNLISVASQVEGGVRQNRMLQRQVPVKGVPQDGGAKGGAETSNALVAIPSC